MRSYLTLSIILNYQVENKKNDTTNERDYGIELYAMFRRQKREHMLSCIHYDRWHRFFVFVLVLINLASGVMSFLASGGDSSFLPSGQNATDTGESVSRFLTKEDKNIVFISARVSKILSILVGCLAFLQVAIQSCSGKFNFGSRSDMHKEASQALERLLETFIIDEKKKGPIDDSISKKVREQRISSVKDLYDQCISSCTSSVPWQIKEAFDLLDSKLQLASLAGKDKIGYSEQKFRATVYLDYYQLLHREISSYWLFPFFLIAPGTAVDKVVKEFKKVKKLGISFRLSDEEEGITIQPESTNFHIKTGSPPVHVTVTPGKRGCKVSYNDGKETIHLRKKETPWCCSADDSVIYMNHGVVSNAEKASTTKAGGDQAAVASNHSDHAEDKKEEAQI